MVLITGRPQWHIALCVSLKNKLPIIFAQMKNFIALLKSYGLLKRLIFGLSLLIVVFAAGAAGYMLIEDYSLLNAVYMTMITIASVGFSEVEPLSDGGKIFTTILIFASVLAYVYTITVVTSFIIEGEFRTYFKHIRVNKEIKELRGHVVVCGYGRNGRQACEQLSSGHVEFVVIESNPQIIEQLRDEGKLFVEGNATEDEMLDLAGIQSAKGLIATLPDDAANVFVVLSAREMNPNLKIISRASSDGAESKLKRAGADNVIMPDKIGGTHMAALITKPDVLEFLDFITGKINITLEELNYHHLLSELKGKTIGELGLPKDGSINIVGFKKGNGDYLVNPEPDIRMEKDSKLFVLGTKEKVERAMKLVKG
jgi:voltage-gated potassium channel